MAICPSCQAQIEIGSEFFGGLFTCPQCSAVYFIGFDGTPEAAQQPVQQYTESPPPYAPEEPIGTPLAAPYESLNSQMEPMVNFEPIIGKTTPEPVFSPLQDIVDFANNENSTSLATYNVEISGLEFHENLQAFKEVLTDSKLQMNFDQIKSQIKNGILILEKLNPAQAAVIAFRLRPLPLEMKWEQRIL